jgi:hypothetical protein
MRRRDFMAGFSAAAAIIASISILAFAGSAFAQALPPPAQSLKDWRSGMVHILLPNKGCFTSSYPSDQWQEVPCTTASVAPMTVTTGNIQATVKGYISTAVGSFDNVTGVTEETSQVLGSGGQVPNAFSLQVNPSPFSTPLCSGAANPAICTGWQQFAFLNPCGIGFSCIKMEYWLRDWGSTNCPSGWTYYNNNGNENCYLDSNSLAVPEQTVANLVDLSLMGQANNGGMDAVVFSTGSALYAVQNEDSFLNLAQNWQSVNFNVLGQCCSTTAYFNSGSTIIVRISIDSGTTSAPSCAGYIFSGASLGESNNLSFASPPAARAGTAPALVFTESSAGGAASPCDSAVELPSGALTDTHDFNGDGMSDIVWRDTAGDVAIWLMNGAAVLSTGNVGALSNTWSIVGQRDFNGDGKADLLFLDTSGNIAMWFMNGTAVASTGNVGNIPANWSVVGTGDFNGDGLGDILWRDTAGDYAVWLMNGATVTSSVVLGNLSPTTWSVVGTGDFNGDGMTDILWQDNLGNTAIWFMNGTTVASAALVGTVANWSVVGTGDFNGDGKSDIVWRDAAGDAAIWLMNGAAVSSAAGLGNVATTWSIALVGDYNGDGTSDLLWRDTSGNTAMWFMNAVAVSSTGFIGNISTVWTVQSVNAE